MRKLTIVLLVTLFLIVCLSAEENFSISTVTVLPIKVASKNAQLKFIASNVIDTISLTIKLLDKYDLVRASLREKQEQHRSYSLKELESISNRYNIDNIIFGSIHESKNNIIFNFSVYNRAKRKIVIKKEAIATSIFDIFEISDKLAIELMEGFTKTHIAFGNINLKNTGEKATYSVFVDKEFIGRNIKQIKHIFYGNHTLTIKQKRMNSEEIIFEHKITIPENETVYVQFQLPYLNSKEQKIFISFDKKIIENLKTQKYSELISTCSTALDTISKMQNLPAYKHLEKKYANLLKFYRAEYSKQKRSIPPAEINVDSNPNDWVNIPINIEYFFDNSPFEYIKFSHNTLKNALFILLKTKQKTIDTKTMLHFNFDTNMDNNFSGYEDRAFKIFYQNEWKLLLNNGIGRQDVEHITTPYRIRESSGLMEIYIDTKKSGIKNKFNFFVELYDYKNKRFRPQCKQISMRFTEDKTNITESFQRVLLSSKSSYLNKNLYESGIEGQRFVAAGILQKVKANIQAQIENGEIPLVKDNSIKIDGHKDDWIPIAPIIEDPVNDKSRTTSSADIYRLYVVHDNKNLFVRLQLADGTLANNYYGIRFSDKPFKYNGSKMFFLFPNKNNHYQVTLDKRLDKNSGRHTSLTSGRLAMLSDGAEFSFPLRLFKESKHTNIYIMTWNDRNGVVFDFTKQKHYTLRF